jgi:hypothetical protein
MSAVVVWFSVVAAGICLLLAVGFGIDEWRAAAKVREAALPKQNATQEPNTVQPYGGVDFAGIAKLAEALEKVNLSGRFLIGAITFTTAATVVTSVGSATGK